MPGVLGAASIPFIACVTLLAAMVLQVLSYAAPFWAYDKSGDFGLWRKYRCLTPLNGGAPQSDLGCYKQDHPWYIGSWLDAVRAMESLAIIFWAIPLVIIPVYIYVALGLYYRCLLGTMTALTLLGAICNLIGFLVYAAQIAKNDDWSANWCFILCIIADGFGFMSFVILLIATCKKPEFTLDQYYTSGYFIHPDRDELYIIGNMDTVKDASIYNGGVKGSTIYNGGQVNPVLVAE